MDLPASVQAKLDRAQQHIDKLLAKIEAFDSRQPYAFVQDHNADLTEHYLHLRLVEPFPSAVWGCILGDAVHNLRSALDHLVYAIAIRQNEGREPPPDHTRLMFPILDPPKPLPMGKIRTLSEPVRAAIEREQPDPAHLVNSPLWTIDQLDIADKHRVIHMTLTHSEYERFRIKPSIPCTFVPTWNMRPLDGRAPLLTLAFDRPVPKVKMGSVGTGLIGIDWIDPTDPNSIIFWPVGNLMAFLKAGVVSTIGRVAEASSL